MQVAVGPLGQFVPLTPAVAPDIQSLAEPRQKPIFMIIYHLLG
jgi:hypothetical protein